MRRLMLYVVASAACAASACFRAPVSPVVEIVPTAAERAAGADDSDALEPAASDWPCWRNSAGDAKSSATNVPTHWSKSANVAWVADVPGRGHASPIVWGDRVFLNSADESSGTQSVLCFDRNSGAPLWTTVAHQGSLMRMHGKNSQASATPACDGRRVYSAFINADALRVTATDLDGQIVWQSEAGPFRSEHGYGSSPVLYKNLVIVAGDNLSSCFLAAMDAQTGTVVWRTARKTTGQHASYATPVIATLANRAQLLFSGMTETSSYDPATGSLTWFCRGPAEVTACTPAFANDLVFSSGGFPEKELLAVRAGGSGDVSSQVVWRTNKGVTYVPSPVFHEGRLYVVNDQGVISCLDAASGKQVWQDRLPGDFSASPVVADGLMFIPNEAGKMYVVRLRDKFELVAANDLGDGGFASPIIAGGSLLIRTNHRLYAIAEH